jgi:hypothetical protein
MMRHRSSAATLCSPPISRTCHARVADVFRKTSNKAACVISGAGSGPKLAPTRLTWNLLVFHNPAIP